MIIINGNKLDVISFINKNSLGKIEQEILTILDQSFYKSEYSSYDELLFELNLRKNIIDSSYELYKSKLNFAVFRKAFSNPKYWNTTKEGGFKLLKDVKSSDAIRDIYINGNLYGTECATAMVIVYYKALLSSFSEDLYNQLFQNIHLMNWHYIDPKLQDIGVMSKQNDYLPGDRRYFKNIDVNYKNPQWQGENVIDLSNDLYYGHGIGIQTAEEIVKTLNKNRKKNSTTSAFLVDMSAIPDFKLLYKQSKRQALI